MLASGRIGSDSSGQAARTFHCNFSSVKLGGGTTALAALDYALREGENERDAGDVEAAAGDKQRVLEAAAKIEESARIRTGRTAERVLVKEVLELPAASTPEQRAACARAFVDNWAGRGHEAVAVVHVHGEESPQPHLHVLAAARPLAADGTVDRDPARRPLADKAAVRRERALAAGLVNAHCPGPVRFHPGKLADTGIERAAKKRIPQGEFRARRAEIRAAPEKAAAIEAVMAAESREKRAALHGESYAAWLKRAPVIEKAKAVGQWPPRSQRQQLEHEAAFWENMTISTAARTAGYEQARAKEDRKALAVELSIAKNERSTFLNIVHHEGGRPRPDLETSEGRDKAWAVARTEMKAGQEVRQLQELNKRQTDYAADLHKKTGRELPDLATAAGQSVAFALVREVAEAGLDAWLQAEAARKKREEKERKEREKRDRLTPGSPSYEAPETAPDPGGKAEAWQLTREQFEARGQPDEAGTRVTFGELDPPSSLVYDPGNTIGWKKEEEVGWTRPPWLYTHGDGPDAAVIGVHAGPDDWKQVASNVHIEEVRRGLDLGREVSDAALESMGRPERAIRLGLVEHPPEPESLITGIIRDMQRVRTLDGPEID